MRRLLSLALLLSTLTLGARAADADLPFLTLADAAAKVRAGEVTSTQLTEAVLARIETYNDKLDAYITVMKDQALAQAAQLDAEAKAGQFRGPLHGVPVALKDNVDTANARTTGGSLLFAGRFPEEDATIVTMLVDAGAVIIGKTNLEEFAMGGGDTSYYGPARNPWNLAHNTGGSSSGSGAAISAFLAYGAIGTDTGGSIRMPASFSGIVGLKATYGLVPIRGIIPLVASRDHAGPMTRTVMDAAIMLNVLAGYDKLDIFSVERPEEDYVATMQAVDVKSLKIGLPAGFTDHLDPEVARNFWAAVEVIKGLTSSVKDMHLPPAERPLASLSEALAWHEDTIKASPGSYMLPHRRSLQNAEKNGGGTAVDYVKGMWANRLLRRTIDDAFDEQGVDLVIVPTHRILPWKLDDLLTRRYDTDPKDPWVTSNCSPFNLYGTPAISIPCGFSEDGLPVGLMIAGKHWREDQVLALAAAYEAATKWHKKQPPLTPDTPKPDVIRPGR